MSDRPTHRGGRGVGGGSRGGRGGGRGGRDGGGGDKGEKPKKENILDLAKYMDKEITVKFNGGREVTGTLKGYDALMNLVLDEVKETVRGWSTPTTSRRFAFHHSSILLQGHKLEESVLTECACRRGRKRIHTAARACRCTRNAARRHYAR